uniref:Uncharacterized protein n=1 Tax=Romanomermis culicivorax TaxID=13658 RepID=A0A915IKY0_ROMCU
MDYDNDNPFRPNGVLSHEVEPIIEEYKQKPFPNSPNRSAANTPLPLAHQQENLVANESSSFNANDSTDSKLRLITDNMSSGGNAASNGVSNAATPSKNNVIEQADVQSHLVTPTKAGKVELVHVENKKKKCRCCCVQ